MTTLTLIGEAFPDFESHAQRSGARALTEALAVTAPRGCSSRILVARDATAPTLHSAKASAEAVPMNIGSLPILWRSGTTARPLDGEFVHSNTPLVPLRSRSEDDGTQTSVMIPHTLAWGAPEIMGASQAKSFRAFAKRAARLADVILAPTHVVAQELRDLLGIEVQVLNLAAPDEYLESDLSASIRSELKLPEEYVVTTAIPGPNGRLEWLLNAMETNESLPNLVVLHLAGEPLAPVRPSLSQRVLVIEVQNLNEVGAALAGAQLLVLPQRALGAGFEVLGALANDVPVLYGDCDAAGELALEAAVKGCDEAQFIDALARLTSEAGAAELARLRMFADDRKHTFSWNTTAWQLWELHANM